MGGGGWVGTGMGGEQLAMTGTGALRDGSEEPASGLAHWWSPVAFYWEVTGPHYHLAALMPVRASVEPYGLTLYYHERCSSDELRVVSSEYGQL